MNEVEMKKCSKCDREFPMNTDYYFKKKDTKDGYTNRCKECDGYKFTNKLVQIPKIGHKFCVKCNREFLIDIKYFPPDKMCKDGFRNVCRECGKDGHFMKDGYIPKVWWTKEEESLLIENYHKYTNQELIDKLFPNETKKSLADKAWKLGISGKDDEVRERVNKEKSEMMSGENAPHYGKAMSDETKRKLSDSIKSYYKTNKSYWLGRKRSENQRKMISRRMRGKWEGNKNPRHLYPLHGKENLNWRGGKTLLYYELRSELKEWKKDSMEKCNYKCVITGGSFDNIHHLYPFKKIVDEVFETLKMDKRNAVEDYTEEEFNKIRNLLNQIHNKYGHGVCLCYKIHKKFHDEMGYHNNTPQQFEEFKEGLRSGKFDDFIKENDLKLII